MRKIHEEGQTHVRNGRAGRVRRLVEAVRLLARDGRIPRPLRALVAFGLLPLPGPVDEVALVLAGTLLWLFHRDRLRAAWAATAAGRARP